MSTSSQSGRKREELRCELRHKKTNGMTLAFLVEANISRLDAGDGETRGTRERAHGLRGEKTDMATHGDETKTLPSLLHEPGGPAIGIGCIDNDYAPGLQDAVAFGQQCDRIDDVLEKLEQSDYIELHVRKVGFMQ